MHEMFYNWLNGHPEHKEAIENEIYDILSRREARAGSPLTSHEIVGFFYNQRAVETLGLMLGLFHNDISWNISALVGVIAQGVPSIHSTKDDPVTRTHNEDAWYL